MSRKKKWRGRWRTRSLGDSLSDNFSCLSFGNTSWSHDRRFPCRSGGFLARRHFDQTKLDTKGFGHVWGLLRTRKTESECETTNSESAHFLDEGWRWRWSAWPFSDTLIGHRVTKPFHKSKIIHIGDEVLRWYFCSFFTGFSASNDFNCSALWEGLIGSWWLYGMNCRRYQAL